MNGDLILTVMTGTILFIGATSLALYQILIGPDQPNYPTSARSVRWALGVWMAFLYYRAAEVITLAIDPTPGLEPVYVTLGQFLSTSTMTIAFALLLTDLLRKWLPAHTHERIRRLLDIASCGRARAIWQMRRNAAAAGQSRARGHDAVSVVIPPASVVGPALAELQLAGIAVVAPGETFDEAFPDAVSRHTVVARSAGAEGVRG